MAPLSPHVVELDGPWRHEYLHTRGVRLHAATLGQPDAPLILCIHGAVGGWFDYQSVLAPLADAGFHVAAIDLRGYGLSDKPPVEMGQDIRTLIGDITGAIQALGHDKAVLVGNDTGAGLAWTVACERPDRVSGVVSISGAHPIDLRRAIAARPWDFSWMLLRSAGVRLPLPLTSRLPLDFLVRQDLQLNMADASAHPDVAELRTQAINIDHTFRGSVWNHRLLTAPLPVGSIGARALCPVLFLHADQQPWNPIIRRARRRARQVAVVHVPGTRNLPHIEDPRGFVDAVIHWASSPPVVGSIAR
ncbi:alpha/beta hydrolase [uncultured Corynebacterium sp.]|uniref:alpha/beta fold hydrolase n=1 Tax=uncultured Corynebacterium sp. TaxID=159447 RepID=UPI0025FECBDD|nr:alpha/beta hydrolase [uncultured Corynebacterium sp.]